MCFCLRASAKHVNVGSRAVGLLSDQSVGFTVAQVYIVRFQPSRRPSGGLALWRSCRSLTIIFNLTSIV